MSEFEINMYPDPIQGGDEKVTRQRGIDPARREPVRDVMQDRQVIQGSPDIFTTRIPMGPHQGFTPDGLTMYSDRAAPSGTIYVDGAFAATGEANPPPQIVVADSPISRDTDAGFPGHPGVVPGVPLAQMAGNVVASDTPAPGQKVEGAPQVFTREDVERAKAAQIATAKARAAAAEKARR